MLHRRCSEAVLERYSIHFHTTIWQSTYGGLHFLLSVSIWGYKPSKTASEHLRCNIQVLVDVVGDPQVIDNCKSAADAPHDVSNSRRGFLCVGIAADLIFEDKRSFLIHWHPKWPPKSIDKARWFDPLIYPVPRLYSRMRQNNACLHICHVTANARNIF